MQDALSFVRQKLIEQNPDYWSHAELYWDTIRCLCAFIEAQNCAGELESFVKAWAGHRKENEPIDAWT